MTADAGDRVVVDLDDTDGRYHRQTLISWWDQNRLAAAKVLVVGAGALGNELVKNLALLGVGTIVVVDLDMVENSNLSRCVLLRESDEGAPKATAVARAAAALNPGVRIVPVVGDVRTAFGLRLFREVDLVIGGLDNREARLYVNQSCWKATTPWIDGAIEGLLGTMRVFSPPDSACYECTMGERDHELLAARKACSLLTRDQMLEGKVPTTATSASIIAAMQVQEAVKLLHRDRLDADFAGRGVAYNGITHDSYVVTYPRRDDCLSHDTYDFTCASEVPAGTTLGALLDQAREGLGDDAVLDFEREIVTAMTCAACDESVSVMRPLDGLTVGAAVCPACGGERRAELAHGVTSGDAGLLAMTPEALGLPPRDIVTGRSGTRRQHYLLGGPFGSLAELGTP
ncbi:ThiF family adenylyltransferase [Baekduia sp.]|jgi:adenylyltransferase/sulfurtransferase|uniref:HesA/MoeB/ThiF family protein n=1 Tax=Baekduia sp. TaxID=2600305 RepID=UPI002E093081|nr:ThiF family adenylyltransferase [Baekduia sp.]